MSKYTPLGIHLMRHLTTDIMMDFQDAEDVLGFPLPRRARTHRAWWANERSGSHVQREAWLGSGYEVDEVDFVQERVTFRRSSQGGHSIR